MFSKFLITNSHICNIGSICLRNEEFFIRELFKVFFIYWKSLFFSFYIPALDSPPFLSSLHLPPSHLQSTAQGGIRPSLGSQHLAYQAETEPSPPPPPSWSSKVSHHRKWTQKKKKNSSCKAARLLVTVERMPELAFPYEHISDCPNSVTDGSRYSDSMWTFSAMWNEKRVSINQVQNYSLNKD